MRTIKELDPKINNSFPIVKKKQIKFFSFVILNKVLRASDLSNRIINQFDFYLKSLNFQWIDWFEYKIVRKRKLFDDEKENRNKNEFYSNRLILIKKDSVFFSIIIRIPVVKCVKLFLSVINRFLLQEKNERMKKRFLLLFSSVFSSRLRLSFFSSPSPSLPSFQWLIHFLNDIWNVFFLHTLDRSLIPFLRALRT